MVTKVIEDVLATRPETRGNDKKLIVAVYNRLGLHLTEEQLKVFYSLPSTETIRRVRQKLNELGRYMPDGETTAYRQNKATEIRQEIRQEKTPMFMLEPTPSKINPFTNS
jgi:hypothetical protein